MCTHACQEVCGSRMAVCLQPAAERHAAVRCACWEVFWVRGRGLGLYNSGLLVMVHSFLFS